MNASDQPGVLVASSIIAPFQEQLVAKLKYTKGSCLFGVAWSKVVIMPYTGCPKKSVPFLVSLTDKGTLFLGTPCSILH